MKHVADQIKERQAALLLLVSYSQDIVQAWDTVSFRTLRSLNDKVSGLKEALEMLTRIETQLTERTKSNG